MHELPSLTVIVPTYREAPNLPELLGRIARVRSAHALSLDVLVMDDDSRDGSTEAVARIGCDWIEIVVREGDRGLSKAVVDGLGRARGEVVVIMDGDLGHPPEAIPDLLRALSAGHQAAVGSRYVAGGSTDEDWTVLRSLNSRAATWLARPLTTLRDPMTGFFAMWRRDLPAAGQLSPVGYKIVLELIVKSRLDDVAEIPIDFRSRRLGESKLTLGQQLLYLEHLRRLYQHKLRGWLAQRRVVLP